MEELNVHIRYVMLWDFRNNENIAEIVKKIRVYGQGVINDR